LKYNLTSSLGYSFFAKHCKRPDDEVLLNNFAVFIKDELNIIQFNIQFFHVQIVGEKAPAS